MKNSFFLWILAAVLFVQFLMILITFVLEVTNSNTLSLVKQALNL